MEYSMSEKKSAEEMLDPESWNDIRSLGHRMVDDMMDYLERVRERSVWRPIPAEVKAQFNLPPPVEGEGAEQAYQDFLQYVLPYPIGNIHPRFWGWVLGTGTPFGMLADMLASGINCTLFGGQQSPVFVEGQVIDWCKQMLGYPAEASGLLVTGGTMANLVGLTVARNTKSGF